MPALTSRPIVTTTASSGALAWHWRLALVASLILGYLLVLVLAIDGASGPPTLGLEAAWDDRAQAWTVTAVQPISLAYDAGVRPGHTLAAADGLPLGVPGSDAPVISRLSTAVVIDPRSGATTALDASSRVPNQPLFAALSVLFFAVGAAVLLFGRGPAPVLLGIACCAGGLELAVLPAAYRQIEWVLVLHTLLVPLAVGSFAGLALVFPVQRVLRVRGWRLTGMLLPWTAVPIGVLWLLTIRLAPEQYARFQLIGYPYVLACLLIGILAFGWSWWEAGQGRQRAQLRIVAAGAALALAPFLLASLLPLLVLGQHLVDPEWTLLALALIPASFGYAILRHQLMDVQLLIRRGLAYSGFALILTGGYALVISAGTLLFTDRAGLSNVVAIALVSAVVAIVGGRLRDRIQERVDRLFERRHYDYRMQLLEFSQRMNAVLNLDELAQATVELVSRTMAPSHTRLYLYEPDSATYQLWVSVGQPARPQDQVLPESAMPGDRVLQRLDAPPGADALTVPLSNRGKPIGLLVLGPKCVDLPYSSEDVSLLRTVANNLALATENGQLYGRVSDLYLSGIRTLAATVDAKDPYTHGHSERVAGYARGIATELGLPQLTVETIELAGLLHDIGKISVPDQVLQKPGRLDPEERALIEQHAALGAKILVDNPALAPLVPLVRHHHEAYDGTGYPDRLAGDDIPLGAAIIAVADTFDTMTTDRPYRKAPGKEKALAEIIRCGGTQFHPDVVAAFVRYYARTQGPVTESATNRVVAHRNLRDTRAGGQGAAISARSRPSRERAAE